MRPRLTVLLLLFASGELGLGETRDYVGHGGPAGGSDAVVVRDAHLIHTAQFLPLDAAGQISSDGPSRQIETVFDNLAAALRSQGSDLSAVVRLNVVVRRASVLQHLEEAVARRFATGARPAVSLVEGALAHPEAWVAIDVVATAAEWKAQPGNARWARVEGLPGSRGTNHVSLLPAGPRVYISGRAGDGDLEAATRDAMEKLRSVLTFLGLGLSQVVQVKAFLKPMTRVAQCEREIVEFFGGNAPPMVFVEWKNPRAIEIEMIAAASDEPSRASSIEFLTPPGMTASPVFARLTRIYHPGTVYLSSLFGKTPGDGERQIYEMFSSLKTVLAEAGTDLRHLAKATYYVTDELTSTKLNEIRREFYDPKRPPAASKASVTGTGIEGRTLAVDMIAVPAK